MAISVLQSSGSTLQSLVAQATRHPRRFFIPAAFCILILSSGNSERSPTTCMNDGTLTFLLFTYCCIAPKTPAVLPKKSPVVCAHKVSLLIPLHRHMIPVHFVITHFSKIHLNISCAFSCVTVVSSHLELSPSSSSSSHWWCNLDRPSDASALHSLRYLGFPVVNSICFKAFLNTIRPCYRDSSYVVCTVHICEC